MAQAHSDERKVRKWITANHLWHEGKKNREPMAVLLGDASDCSRLRYWGLLTNLSIDEHKGTTTYTLDRIRKLKQTHSPQELVLRSSGKTIARNFIRPYAICLSPEFISETK